jgi:hypothetical protein
MIMVENFFELNESDLILNAEVGSHKGGTRMANFAIHDSKVQCLPASFSLCPFFPEVRELADARHQNHRNISRCPPPDH